MFFIISKISIHLLKNCIERNNNISLVVQKKNLCSFMLYKISVAIIYIFLNADKETRQYSCFVIDHLLNNKICNYLMNELIFYYQKRDK